MARGRETQLEEVREPDDEAVARRLAELGIPLRILTEAVRVGHLQGDFKTAAHPRTYPGTVVWGEMVGSLRGDLSVLAWSLDDTDNIPRAISPDGKVVVIPVRGNERTGLRSKHEQLSTRRRRGEAGVRIIKVNTQYMLQLEDGAGALGNFVANLGGTWFLLYNRIDDVVRSELSFAKGVDKTGRLFRWAERLVLPDLDLLQPPPEEEHGGGGSPPDVDVPVSRRAG